MNKQVTSSVMMQGALTTVGGGGVPVLFAPSSDAKRRFIEFFTANIRNPNTRRSYTRAAGEFAAWCESVGLGRLDDIQPVHVATYIEGLQGRLATPSIKLQLAAIRVLFDWLVVGQVVPFNPASPVRAPKHSVKKGKTPVLAAEEARALLDAIDIITVQGLRDRALIGLMVYTFARVGAAVAMRAEDVYVQGRRSWVRLHEKGGKQHEMPCHHNLDEYLHRYIEAAGLTEGKAWLFQSMKGRTGTLRATHAASGRVPHDCAPGCCGEYPHQSGLSQFPRHGHHRISTQRRQARNRAAHGQSRKRPHHGLI